ncbi:MAG: Uma2 family endonuclease [Jaaginema sp. PMC 1079.18]|nr:Uma2 family endonuclease [Jaaginema sp. PMC 1080.18]MEC4850737.1 Uma2 family endonuclease [Jaaginema sp. PMC 1079.18]MEC4865275.1 Uma2 family endonuclease [Jaaginema sp. PMC 1078.18]
MTVIPLTKTPIAHLQIEPGSVVKIPNLPWHEFENLLTEWGEKRAARIIYFQETLEIMVPLPEHEKSKHIITDIITTLLKKAEQEYESFGSTTFRKLGIVGLEPDACFYITNASRMIGRLRLEASDPPPDLAIEIDVTSRTSLEAYAALGVPELWIYDSQGLHIYLLENNTYQERDRSPIFPNLSLREIVTETIQQSWQIGYSRAIREFETKLTSEFP